MVKDKMNENGLKQIYKKIIVRVVAFFVLQYHCKVWFICPWSTIMPSESSDAKLHFQKKSIEFHDSTC